MTDLTAKLHETRLALEEAGHLVTLDGRMAEATTAELIGVTPATLRTWRSLDAGPPYLRICGRVWYPLDQVIEWLYASARNVDGR